MMVPDWKPKRRGKIYCSSACGGNCTWAAYRTAKKMAAALAKELGKGWRTRVWENLGWHFSARHVEAGLDIYHHPGNPTPWSAGLNGRYWMSGRTPAIAIRKTLKTLRTTADELVARVEAAERAGRNLK